MAVEFVSSVLTAASLQEYRSTGVEYRSRSTKATYPKVLFNVI
jgi:hypothetical protein